jgi:hypothetical protein
MSTPRTTIRVRRSPLRQARVGGRPLGWVYDYVTPVDIDWHSADGTSRPGPRAGSWTAANRPIADLRKYLRRTYPNAELVEEWKFQPRDGGPREPSCTEPDCHGMHPADYHAKRSAS